MMKNLVFFQSRLLICVVNNSCIGGGIALYDVTKRKFSKTDTIFGYQLRDNITYPEVLNFRFLLYLLEIR